MMNFDDYLYGRDPHIGPNEREMVINAFHYIRDVLFDKPGVYGEYVKQQIEYLADLLDYRLVEKGKIYKTDSFQNDLTELLEHHEEGKKSN